VNYLLRILSFLIVALAAPFFGVYFAPLAAALGYGMFWVTLEKELPKKKFFLGALWQFAVQLVHLKWLATTTYNGPLMVGVYLFSCALLGSFFGLLSTNVGPRLKGIYILGFASLGMIFEYVRWFPLCGFSWSPAGLFLSTFSISAQMASFGGILFLSFWVYLTNAAFVQSWFSRKLGVKAFRLWAIIALAPYIFGVLNLQIGQLHPKGLQPYLSALVVQPCFAPPVEGVHPKDYTVIKSPVDNWRHIFKLIASKKLNAGVDLIALPEAAFAFEANELILPKEAIGRLFRFYFRETLDLPDTVFVTHNDVLKAVSVALKLPILTGHIDTCSKSEEIASLAAFFQPNVRRSYYAKRRLFPVAEYMPYDWCKKIGADFGIYDAFSPGTKPKVFTSIRMLKNFPSVPFPMLGPMVCYEETFPIHASEATDLGADLLVGLSNDAWYPKSGLEEVHLAHARVRAIENGTPFLRVCNTGVSGVIDARGKLVDAIESEKPAAATLRVPLSKARAPYTIMKDKAPLLLAALFMLLSFMRFMREKRSRFVLA
jgi:apolipoprotein N-acyltransferase